MRPAFSIIFFTALAGSAQGLVVAIAVAVLSGLQMSWEFQVSALGVALILLLTGLVASFGHLGRPERAWRTVLMWRTSWMSREVIVLPAFIALVATWTLIVWRNPEGISMLLPLLSIAGAFVLWYCTAMIYACLRFVQEWAHPLTIINYTLIGLSSGLILTSALAALHGEIPLLLAAGPWALVCTIAAWLGRMLALRRNARIKPKSDLQSATGIKGQRLVQKAMGMTGGSFNTREFFHGASVAALKSVKLTFIALAFAVPTVLLILGLSTGRSSFWLLALAIQAPGLIAERWFFFAQARHPQNLYYQVVS